MGKAKVRQLYERPINLRESPPDRFFVARIIEDPHMNHLTKQLALQLGRNAVVRTPRTLHVTVGNGYMRGRMLEAGFSAEDIIAFATDLKSVIHKRFGGTADKLAIHTQAPFMWSGRGAQTKLALQLSSSVLEEQRGAIGEFFTQRTGLSLAEEGFKQHITLADVRPAVARTFADCSEELVEGIYPMQKVGAGCLDVYMQHIHPRGYVWGLKKS